MRPPPGPLFAFGTLMDADVLGIVCAVPSGSFATEPARVRGWARRAVLDDHYPVLVPAPDGAVEGLLIHGLDDEALARVAFFEGEEFVPAPIVVERIGDGPGGGLEAWYFAQSGRKPIDEAPWELAEWQAKTKVDTLSRVHRYMSWYGKLSVAEADARW